ncbi:MAG: hypothetical protein LBR22_09460 [Desulfovibrio sp.]|nr:hypothetical protein [Desulfovibrio sp.]
MHGTARRIRLPLLLAAMLCLALAAGSAAAATDGKGAPKAGTGTTTAKGNADATPAGTSPALFGEFRYNAPKAEIAALKDAVPAEGEFAGDILLPPADFAGHRWTPRLSFDGDRLVRVSLMARVPALESERLEAVRGHLAKEGYEVLGLVADGKTLDCISRLKIGYATTGDAPAALAKDMAKFLEGRHARITYAWFDTKGLSRENKRTARNLGDFLVLAPAETREAEVTLIPDPGGKEAMLLVDFTYPILDAMRNGQK